MPPTTLLKYTVIDGPDQGLVVQFPVPECPAEGEVVTWHSGKRFLCVDARRRHLRQLPDASD